MDKLDSVTGPALPAQTMRIAVLVPCFNEEAAVAFVIADFRKALPSAEIFVYDNNSSDRTVAVACDAGAQVRSERRQGKGHVVRRMFADIDADIYVLVDGDATYDAASAPGMIDALLSGHLDMVVGFRVDQVEAAYRPGHRIGNRMLTGFLSSVFGQAFKDTLSGYRVFSRRFVKSFPVLSDGFEIETELSVHALELALPVAEIETPYYVRPEGSFSKLNTWRDGFRILGTILKLYRSEKPLPRYGDARTPRDQVARLFVSTRCGHTPAAYIMNSAAITDSQSVKSAEKGGPASIRMAMMRARKSKVRSATFS